MKSSTAVRQLGALAQKTRLAIFRALVRAGDGSLSAGAVSEAVAAPASTVSFHLKELADSGLVNARREGRFIYYGANYPAVAGLVRFVKAKCCEGMPQRRAARHLKAGGPDRAGSAAGGRENDCLTARGHAGCSR